MNPIIKSQDITKVLVVEAQQVIPTKLQIALESESDIKIVAVANNGVAAFDKIAEFQPDLVMIDLELTNICAITMVEIIKERYPQIKTLIISNNRDNNLINRVILAGAKGYLAKSSLGKNIIKAIRIINQGYFQLSLGC